MNKQEKVAWAGAFVFAVLIWQLLAVPFYLFGGKEWGYSASAVILFWVIVISLNTIRKEK